MTSSHGRRIQGRRALAILSWITLVAVAGLLWFGQYKRIIRIQAWEPAALLLSAYATFLAIFGWLLFSPGRKSAEESPGLFFAGMLTLLPPCFIAYHLMPVGSPLRPWITIGVFVFGVIAIMSPLPDEVFAVPRDRRAYLQPLTDAYLTDLNVEEPQIRFDNIAPRTAFRLSQPSPDSDTSSGSTVARDPWADPFYGTGRQLSRIGVSQSRRSEDASRSERRRLTDDNVPGRSAPRQSALHGVLPSDDHQPSFGNLQPPRPVQKAAVQDVLGDATGSSPTPGYSGDVNRFPASPVPVTQPGGRIAPFSIEPPLRSTDIAAVDYSTRSSAVDVGSASAPPVASTSSTRRPLTEPSGRSVNSVGFQTPQAPAPTPKLVQPVPPPLPSSAFPLNSSPAAPPSLSALPIPLPSFDQTPRTPVAPLETFRSMETTRDLVARADQVRGVGHSDAVAGTSAVAKRTLAEPVSQVVTSKPSSSAATFSLQEQDRQLRELEAMADLDETESPDVIHRQAIDSASLGPAAGVTRTVQQSSGDVTLERIQDEHGGEMIEGTIKVFFEVGQKRAHLHVPFSPPLAGLPEVECEPAGDAPIRLKVAVRQPYGVRIEARRAEASEALNTEISFAAVYTPSSRRG